LIGTSVNIVCQINISNFSAHTWGQRRYFHRYSPFYLL
jgi:hypothetical protein